MKFNNLRTHLFLAFSVLSVIFISTLLGALYFYNKRNRITESVRQTDDQRVLALKSFKLADDFLTFETKNEHFFRTGKSEIKKELERNNILLLSNLAAARKGFSKENSEVQELLDSIFFYQHRYYKNFLETESLVKQKGFKDFGAEGKMRKYAHQLMEIKNPALEAEVLMLRRHEKDFIIRREDEYISKFNSLCDALSKQENKFFREKTSWKFFADRLHNYRHYFNEYCLYQKEIGSNENEGILKNLDTDYKNIDRLFDVVKEKTLNIEHDLYSTLKLIITLLIIITICIALAFSYFYSRRISRSANVIKENMNKYVLSGFTDCPTEIKAFHIAEFDMISAHFLRMAGEIDGYVNFFKIKVEERTNEIRKQKEELELQRHKIQIQRDLLVNQKWALVEKNKNLMDSISYAERIQKAMLPDEKEVKRVFADSFIYYEPKDIVSGDFYWIQEIAPTQNEVPALEFADQFNGGATTNYLHSLAQESKTEKAKATSAAGEKILLALADCTGHGVPGAFMSIMGINHLDKICREHKVTDPAKILAKLNEEIENSLKQSQRSGWLKDGMDIACCSFDLDKMKLRFSGANKKLWLVRENQLYEFNGDYFPIGSEENLVFKSLEIELERDDCIYLCSDGFQDQFGGPERKKFKSRNLKELLLKINYLPMHDQLSVLRRTFYEWKGNTFQVDDVTVLGIRI